MVKGVGRVTWINKRAGFVGRLEMPEIICEAHNCKQGFGV